MYSRSRNCIPHGLVITSYHHLRWCLPSNWLTPVAVATTMFPKIDATVPDFQGSSHTYLVDLSYKSMVFHSFPWVFHGFSMGFPWVFHSFPWVFQGFLWFSSRFSQENAIETRSRLAPSHLTSRGLRTTATSFEAPVSAASHHPGASFGWFSSGKLSIWVNYSLVKYHDGLPSGYST